MLRLRQVPLVRCRWAPTTLGLRNYSVQKQLPNANAQSTTNPTGLTHKQLLQPLSLKQLTVTDVNSGETSGILTPPPPDAGFARRTIHRALQLAKFYFLGIKAIFTRRSLIRTIRARIASPDGSPLTRSEFRLIHQHSVDVRRVIPFVIIALLLEEVIPLIVIWAPFLLPSTCILPSQQDRIDAKRAEKANGLVNVHKTLFASLAKEAQNHHGLLSLDTVKSHGALAPLCSLVGISSVGIDYLRTHRLRRHLEFIQADDKLLLQDPTPLSRKELLHALGERAIWPTQDAHTRDLQAHLSAWLDAVRNLDTSSPSTDATVSGKDSSSEALERRLALLIPRSAQAS